MHHVNDFRIVDESDEFIIIFYINHQPTEIILRIPKSGVIEGTNTEVGYNQITAIAVRIGTVLSQGLVPVPLPGTSSGGTSSGGTPFGGMLGGLG